MGTDRQQVGRQRQAEAESFTETFGPAERLVVFANVGEDVRELPTLNDDPRSLGEERNDAVARWVDEVRRPVVGPRVSVDGRWVVDLTQVRVLAQESPELRVEVPGFGVVGAGLPVEEVPCETESVLGGFEFFWISVVAPGI
jgi:Fe-S-cluster formation regulator IscX/YfhJ